MLKLHLVCCWVRFASSDLCVMDLSSSNEQMEETPPACKPFLQLAAFAKQLHNSVPPLGRSVQAA